MYYGEQRQNATFDIKSVVASKQKLERSTYIREGSIVIHALWPFSIFCTALLLIHPAALHFEKSAVSFWWGPPLKSPGFVQCSPRCLNLNVASTTQSQRTWKSILIACLHLPHMGLSTSHSLSRYLFRGQCPVSSPIIIHCGFWLKFSNSLARIAEGLLRNTLACPCPGMDCQCSSCFLFVQPMITALATLAYGQRQAEVLWVDARSLPS